MKKIIILIISLFTCFSVLLLASGGQKEKKLSNIEILEKYTNIEITKNYVLLSWEPFEESNDKFINSKHFIDSSKETIGYLIFIKQKKKNALINKTKLIEKYKQKIYFSDERCMYLPRLKAKTDYEVDLISVVKVKKGINSVLELVNLFNVNRANSHQSITINMPKKYSSKLGTKKCKAKEIIKVSLKELYENKERYVNTIIEVGGYYNLSEKQTLHKFKKHEITKLKKKSDGLIVNNGYVLHIPGFWKTTWRYKKNFPKKNYISIVGYIYKYTFETDTEEEIEYKFRTISVTEIKRK